MALEFLEGPLRVDELEIGAVTEADIQKEPSLRPRNFNELISAPLRGRFGIDANLDFYSHALGFKPLMMLELL